MTYRPVQAVFFWRADMLGIFKAAYGRIAGQGGYTKDFFQPRGELARALERALGTGTGVPTDLEWRWPGGGIDAAGKLLRAADFDQQAGRLNLRWQTNHAPPPWRLTPNPTATSLSTLRGLPGLESVAQADAQRAALIEADEGPWFIAVHLADEGPVLHTRVVLQRPQPGREYADWNSLPPQVRNEMAVLPLDVPGGFVEFMGGSAVRAGAIVDRVMQAFIETRNVLLVGPPGTGKTIALEDIRRAFQNGGGVGFDTDALHGAFDGGTSHFDGETKVQSLVFHPSYAYEDFVIGLVPKPVEGGVSVEPRVGPLLRLARFASEPDHRSLLVCDEFNRGAAASIFGDTLALLDTDKRSVPGAADSGATIATPYFGLDPEVDGHRLDELTSFPSTLYILAAMNSADRSVAPLDAALRRRFAIIYVGPDYDLLRSHLGIDDDFVLGEPATWTAVEHIKALAVAILEAVNDRVEAISGRDFLLGHSLMWHVDGSDTDEALRSLASAIDNHLLGTLTLSFTDNDAALAAVLNVGPPTDRGDELPVAAATWHYPSEALSRVAGPRLRPTRFLQLRNGDRITALRSLLDPAS